jgi:hypothetical protein
MTGLVYLSPTRVLAMQRAMASGTLYVDSQGGSQLHVVSCACPILALWPNQLYTQTTILAMVAKFLGPCMISVFLPEEVSIKCQGRLLFVQHVYITDLLERFG